MNKNIIIFGGTGELMGHIAIGLSNDGHNIIIVGRNEESAKKIIGTSGNIEFYKFEIMKDNITKLFNYCFTKYKKIDMLINGAGINSAKSFLDIELTEILNIFNINFTFPLVCCQEYIGRLLKNNISGKILNIGSVSALNPLSKVYTYSASKAALHNLSKNLAREYGDKKILTNILVPGFFPAKQNRKILDKERKKNIITNTPLGRFGNPNELVGIVKYLLSNESSFMNGSEIVIDGGYSITKI